MADYSPTRFMLAVSCVSWYNLAMIDFATVLKNLRIQRSMSQADLARILSVSRSTISSYENGTRTPDRDTLLKIANCFMVSTDFLLGREPYNSSIEYGQVLSQIDQLLHSSPLDPEQKKAILTEVADYFRWKLSQAQQNPDKK